MVVGETEMGRIGRETMNIVGRDCIGGTWRANDWTTCSPSLSSTPSRDFRITETHIMNRKYQRKGKEERKKKTQDAKTEERAFCSIPAK